MKILSRTLILVAIFAISGCFKNNADEFGNQKYRSRPLIIPNNLSKENIDDYYPIPEIEKNKTGKVSLIPPGSKITKE